MVVAISVDMIHGPSGLPPRNYMFVGEFEQNGRRVMLWKRGRQDTKFWAKWR